VKRRRHRFVLKYSNGEQVRVRDKVLVFPNRAAVVEAVLRPGTKVARDYYVEKEGGILLRFEDGTLELWVLQPWWSVGDEMELVDRG
jgi:hypothetical protein